MGTDEKHRRSPSDRPIERGETYSHSTHGRVEVTDIWHGTEQVDTPPPPGERDPHAMVVVRYIPAEGDDWSDELADTWAEFRDAIETRPGEG